MRPDEEINAEIETLRTIKPRVRRFGVLSGDNHILIDLQVEVLTNRMSERQVHERVDGAAPEEGGPDILLFDALEAYYWMQGVQDDKPSAGWADIFIR